MLSGSVIDPPRALVSGSRGLSPIRSHHGTAQTTAPSGCAAAMTCRLSRFSRCLRSDTARNGVRVTSRAVDLSGVLALSGFVVFSGVRLGRNPPRFMIVSLVELVTGSQWGIGGLPAAAFPALPPRHPSHFHDPGDPVRVVTHRGDVLAPGDGGRQVVAVERMPLHESPAWLRDAASARRKRLAASRIRWQARHDLRPCLVMWVFASSNA